MLSNTSIELVKWGKPPRQPLDNHQRLQQFRKRMAATAQAGFNTVFLAGKNTNGEASNAKR